MGCRTRYENAHGLDKNNGSDANLDSDGDGMTNLQEYRAGTDPRSAASRLRIISLDVSADAPQISFPTVGGKTYRIEYCDNLAQGTWNILGHNMFTQTATTLQVQDAGATGGPRRFYRLRVKP